MIVGGRFEILREAGAGGMAVVYEAADRATGGRVALKVLADSAHASRFAREAEVLADLSHEAIVRYVAHGTDGPTAYLAMEWLDGEDLAVRLARGPLAIDETLALARRVAEAVAFAHARGIVHRDLKPSNVLLVGGRADRAKVLDFGLARGAAAAPLTHVGAVMGSVGYLSPEQARGVTEVDARSDVFSLGCILFECATGKAAFSGEHAVAILAKLLVEDAPRVRAFRPEAPGTLDALVAAMLERNPERRPRDAGAVAETLARIDSRASIAPGAPLGPTALGRDEQRLMSVILVGERRERSVGSSSGASSAGATMISLHGPEARGAIEATTRAFGAALEVAGDGTMVVTMREGDATDRASRAAKCALALRAACPGAGIALALGRGTSDGASASGEVIERAAALLARAASDATDAVHVEPSTVPLLEARFVVGARGDDVLLHGERQSFAPARLVRGRVTPFVGRSRELATLDAAFTSAIVDAQATAVLVVGEAGSGKSRLREEAVRAMKRRDASASVWTLQGEPLRAQSPLGAVATLLRALAAIGEKHGAAAQDALRARLAESMEGDALAHAAIFLAEVVGAPHDGATSAQLRLARDASHFMKDHVTRAWTAFVGAELARAPLVVVVEDAHWIDAASMQLALAALGAHRDAPLAVFAFARPEALDLFPSLWGAHGAQTLHLAPLSPRAAEKLAREALDGVDVDERALAEIVERAAGSPFVIEELVRARAESTHGEGALPDGVLALVQARLEALDPTLRRVMRAASVFGRVAREEGIARLLGDEDAMELVRSSLRALVTREVLEPSKDDARVVRFRHDLVRDAAYAMLTDSDRAVGHALAGAWLESAGEGDAAVLARHFDLGGDAARAASWHARAAEQALDGTGAEAIIAHAARALELGAAGEVRARSLYARSIARLWRGETRAGLDDARAALEGFAPGSAAWFAALHQGVVLGDIAGKRREVADLVALALDTPPADERARAWRVRAIGDGAMTRYHEGDPVGGEKLVLRCEEEAPPVADEPAVAITLHRMRGLFAAYRGDHGEEANHWIAARDLYDAVQDRRGAATARVNLGYTFMMLGALDRAEESLRSGLELGAELKLARVTGAARHNLGLVLAYRGRFEEAVKEQRAGLETFIAAGDDRLTAAARIYLAMIHTMAGDLELAESVVREAFPAVDALPGHKAYALSVLARIVLRRGRVTEADAIATDAARVFETSQGEAGEALLYLARAETMLAIGRNAEADTVLESAVRKLEAIAARISDPDLRASFLGVVPENAEILALAASRGVR